MRVAIAYHSGYGHTERQAQAVADGADAMVAGVHGVVDDFPVLRFCTLCRKKTTLRHTVVGPECVPCRLYDQDCWARASPNYGGSGPRTREETSFGPCIRRECCKTYSCFGHGVV